MNSGGGGLGWLLAIGLALICAFVAIARHTSCRGRKADAIVFSALGFAVVVVWSSIIPLDGVSWTMFFTVWMVPTVITWASWPESGKASARQ